MPRPSGALLAFSLMLCATPERSSAETPAAVSIPPPHTRLGINLASPRDSGTELPFVDVFRLSGGWVGRSSRTNWGKGPRLDLDTKGWVKRLPPGCWAETVLCNISGGHYPGGEYVVHYKGTGTLEFGGAAEVVSRRPHRITLRVDPDKGLILLKLTATSPSDPIHDIRVLLPGHEMTYTREPWNPDFLKLWEGVAALRFMEWMRTNDSTVESWSDRPTVDDATFTTKGVPAELMIDLANRLKIDPWFCMPHRADDGYVRNFAELVRAKLDPGRKVFIEYSNEVWNGSFRQHEYARERGQKLGFGVKPWEAAWRFTGYRSSQVFRTWEGAFGGRGRLVRVLASQAACARVSEEVVAFGDAYKQADALAIAPFMLMALSPSSKPSAGEVAGWSADQVLDHLEQRSLPESIEWMRQSKDVADRFGLRLIAYEGGQHMVGIQGGENIEALTAVLTRSNGQDRIGGIYVRYLEAWRDVGGDLFCHYASVGEWTKWGSWGLLRHLNDDPRMSPKWVAVMSWARSLGQKVSVSVGSLIAPPRLEVRN